MKPLQWPYKPNVHELHNAGLIHYDLKLRNILIKPDKNATSYDVGVDSSVMLCDLDASAPVDSLRSDKAKHGSSAYYAPEIARWNVTSKSDDKGEFDQELRCMPTLDVWSLGVVVYEIMALRSPWSSKDGKDPTSFPALVLRILNASPDYSVISSLYPTRLIDMVRWMLQRNLSKRATAAATTASF